MASLLLVLIASWTFVADIGGPSASRMTLGATHTVDGRPSTLGRVQEILARFDKRKHKNKQRPGMRDERFVEVHGEADPRADVREYAGTYEERTLGETIELRVGGDGRVEAFGTEAVEGKARRFTLRDVRIDGALLFATKVYEDGAAAPFDGLFMKLERAEGISPQEIQRRSTAVGFGVVEQRQFSGGTLDRLFYERKGD